MARADYVNRVKDILYGSAIGEAPPLRVAKADAAEAISGSIVTFEVESNEGDQIKAGHTLAVDDASDPTNCFVLYVTGVFGNQVVARNAYQGSPAVTASDLDSAILEQNPLVSTYKIHKDIDTIFATSLWPEVFKFATTTVTPNLATGQADLPAAAMDIDSAWQTVGGIDSPIPYHINRNVHTTLSANGVLGQFGFVDGSTTYITYIAKLVLGDEDEDVNGLVEMVATGAAALALGATVSESAMASSSKDSQSRGQRDVAASLWRDFLTLRSNYREGLSRERGNTVRISRG